MVSSNSYDIPQFIVGLQGWPEGRLEDNEYVLMLEKYIQTSTNDTQGVKLIVDLQVNHHQEIQPI